LVKRSKKVGTGGAGRRISKRRFDAALERVMTIRREVLRRLGT